MPLKHEPQRKGGAVKAPERDGREAAPAVWPHRLLVVSAIVAGIAMIAFGGSQLLRGQRTRQSRQVDVQRAMRDRVREDAEAIAAATARFRRDYASQAGIEVHDHVRLVDAEDADVLLLRTTQPVPGNTSLARVPFASLIDAVMASALLPRYAAAVSANAPALWRKLQPVSGDTASFGEQDQALGRLKVLLVLVALRRQRDFGSEDPHPTLGRYRDWVSAALPISIDDDLHWLPEVASRCLDASDRRNWENQLKGVARDRAAIVETLFLVDDVDALKNGLRCGVARRDRVGRRCVGDLGAANTRMADAEPAPRRSRAPRGLERPAHVRRWKRRPGTWQARDVRPAFRLRRRHRAFGRVRCSRRE
jgi:hypothetical protein